MYIAKSWANRSRKKVSSKQLLFTLSGRKVSFGDFLEIVLRLAGDLFETFLRLSFEKQFTWVSSFSGRSHKNVHTSSNLPAFLFLLFD